MIRKIRIDNSADSAVQSEKWNPDVKSILEDCRDASNYRSVIHEMFLEAPDDTTRLRVVDCKYPHHRLEDGKLVLDRKGVQAAYARAKQQNLYQENEAVREHIDRHRQELGMIEAEKKHEQAVQDIDRAYKLLQEALLSPKPSAEPDENLFVSMMEKPQISAPQTGTPIAPADNTQPAAAPVDNTQAAPQPAAPEQPTIELTQVNQGEDTSTNNPVEGPDDRDPDNLDGNQRKEMYQSFADVMIQANNQNVFGTIFDEDVFRSEYKIVPYEMRYFYRLQNPVSVEVDELAFIPFGKDLLDAQEKYGLGKKMFVFATKSDKPIFFNMLDKTIWLNDDKVGDSFDGFIETLTQNNGVLPESDEQGENMDANVVDTTQGEDMTPPADTGTEPVLPAEGGNDQPIDLTQPGSVPAQGAPTVNTGLEPAAAPPAQPGAADNMQPVDLTNASVEADDSVLAMLRESTDSDFSEGDITQPADGVTEYLSEASQGALKFCYRIIVGGNERYLVIYRLEPEKIVQAGWQLFDANDKVIRDVFDHKHDDNPDVQKQREQINLVKSTIRRNGHVNFAAQQAPIKIIKLSSGEYVTSVRGEGAFETEHDGQKLHDSPIVYKVGVVESRPTYKTTTIGIKKGMTSEEIEAILKNDQPVAEYLQNLIDTGRNPKVKETVLSRMRGMKATYAVKLSHHVIDQKNEEKRIKQLKQLSKDIDFPHLYSQIKGNMMLRLTINATVFDLDKYAKILQADDEYREYRSVTGVQDAIQIYKSIVKFLTEYNRHVPDEDQIKFKPIPHMKKTFDESIDPMMSEGVAFPNDALDQANKRKALERERRRLGQLLLG